MLGKKSSIFSNCSGSNSPEMQIACAELEAIAPRWVKLPQLFEDIYCIIADETRDQQKINEYRWKTIHRVKQLLIQFKRGTND